MAFTATVSEQIISGGNTIVSSTAYSGSGRISIDETIADATTDQVIAMSLDVSQIQTIYIVASVAMLFETNAIDATGGNSISLVAGKPLIWWTGSYYTNLLTLDITIAYITNASGSSGTFKLECVYDSTP